MSEKNILDLQSYPSFQNMTDNEELVIQEKFKELYKKGEIEKWLVDFNEIDIRNKIGEGSNAIVQDCFWRNSTIVIKTPKTKKIKLLVENLKEIEIWSSLRHPNLVQFLGMSFNFTSNIPYILLEKIRGNTLQQLLENKNASIQKSLKNSISMELINAISFLHNCKPPIIYRDLKPDNIMLDHNNSVKLTDFGLSRFLPCNSDFKLTGETGTIRYMAPEVFNRKTYGLNADVYSLGLILYYLSTRHKPFQGYSVADIGVYFGSDELLFSTNMVKNKDLKHIINMSISKDPTKRWDINDLANNINIVNETRDNKCIIC